MSREEDIADGLLPEGEDAPTPEDGPPPDPRTVAAVLVTGGAVCLGAWFAAFLLWCERGLPWHGWAVGALLAVALVSAQAVGQAGPKWLRGSAVLAAVSVLLLLPWALLLAEPAFFGTGRRAQGIYLVWLATVGAGILWAVPVFRSCLALRGRPAPRVAGGLFIAAHLTIVLAAALFVPALGSKYPLAFKYPLAYLWFLGFVTISLSPTRGPYDAKCAWGLAGAAAGALGAFAVAILAIVAVPIHREPADFWQVLTVLEVHFIPLVSALAMLKVEIDQRD